MPQLMKLYSAYPGSDTKFATFQVYGDGSTTSDVPTNEVDMSPGLPPDLANYASADFNNWNASIQEVWRIFVPYHCHIL